MKKTVRFLFVVNVDWFFVSHRLPIALELLKRGHEVHIATAITDKKAELEQYGFSVSELRLKRASANPFELINSFSQIYSLVKRLQPDILHLVTIKPVLLGGIAARLAAIPAVVFAISGLGAVFLGKGVVSTLRRLIVRQIYGFALRQKRAKIIFQNRDDQKTISSIIPLSEEQIVLVKGSGVDLSIYKQKPLPKGRPVVMLAARFLRDKGVQEFVGAVRFLQKKKDLNLFNPRYVLVGEVDLDNPASFTQRELEAIEAEGNIELWGYRSDMQNVLPQAHIVVLPSYREGFPKVLMEAAACGRAVVTTDVPGCRDAIKNGKTGLLVPVKDSKALALTIEKLLKEPGLVKLMGENGRNMAEVLFDIQQIVTQHMHVYDDLCESF